jgi:pilus assembly protein CpaD
MRKIVIALAALPLLLAGCKANTAANEPPPYQPKEVRVALVNGRYVAVPPACPDWSTPEANTFTNEPSSNFGCASEVNLASMVANPADLARGNGKPAADGDLAALRVKQYRAGLISHSLDQKSSSSGGGSSGGNSGSGAQN